MSITLTRRSVPAAPLEGERHTWPLEVVAESHEEGIPSEIFVYHLGAANMISEEDPYPGDRFECVASVHQLSTIPALDPEDPGESSQVPFYRTATLFFHCLSPDDAASLWEKVQADVNDLIVNFRAVDLLAEDASVDIG